MQLFVVRLVRGFVPQQIAVGARLEHGLIRLARKLAERQRDRAVGELRLDAAHRAADFLHAERAVLAALHDERAEAEMVALAGALENLVLGQPVAVGVRVGAADAAVQAVVAADISDLDQAADINVRAIDLTPDTGGKRPRIRCGLFVLCAHEKRIVLL